MKNARSFLMEMAKTNRFDNMQGALSRMGDDISAEYMENIIWMYLQDLCSFLNGLQESEYRNTVRGCLLDSGLLSRLTTMNLSNNMNIGDVISHISSDTHLRYNMLLNAVLIGNHNGKWIPSVPSKNLVSLWAIYNLFVKGVLTKGGNDKALGKELLKCDHNFQMISASDDGWIMYHIRNAIAHGTVSGGIYMTFTDKDPHNPEKKPYVGIMNFDALSKGLEKSIPMILSKLKDPYKEIYTDILDFLTDKRPDLGLRTNYELACLTLPSNFQRYCEYDRVLLEGCRDGRKWEEAVRGIEFIGDMDAKMVRNAFSHNIHLESDKITLDGKETMSLHRFMAYNDILKFVDDLLVLKCIAGSKDLERRWKIRNICGSPLPLMGFSAS